MRQIFVRSLAFVIALFISGSVFAVNLMQVYRQALTADPTFQQQYAQWLSDRENIAISRSALLPQLDLTANASRGYVYESNPLGRGHFYNTTAGYSLQLSQPLFNLKSWADLQNAKAAAKASEANYAASAQDLMYRVASKYFAVLQAQDVLRYTTAEKESIGRQLERTNQLYKVGLIAITSVYQAQASYDSTVADEIAARNDLANKIEELREITGKQYHIYSELGKLPLVRPDPENITQWVRVSLQQNYGLLAARYGTLAAMENIKSQRAGHLPVVSALGNYGYSYNSNSDGAGHQKSTTASIGVGMDLPIYQGGLVNAQTQQAEYDYERAVATQELTKRSVVSQTRQAYLGVLSLIGKIKADKQAIVSNASALKSTEAGYIVGTQTMVDVLAVQTDLYNAQKNYSIDQYSYILQTIQLKQEAGTLAVSDLQQINSWLREGAATNDIALKLSDTSSSKTVSSKTNVSAHRVVRKTNVKRTATIKKHVKRIKPVKHIKQVKHVKRIKHAKHNVAPVKPILPKPQIMETKTVKAQVHAVNGLTSIEKQLLRKDPTHYALQLAAATNQQRVIAVVNQLNIKEPVYVYAAFQNGQHWYKLIVGDYSSFAAADAAVQKLPANFRSQHPWVRSYAVIQAEIRTVA